MIEDGLITFEAARDLDTHDNMDRAFIDDNNGGITHVIGAWGASSEMHYHGPDNRVKGTVSFFLDHDDEKNSEVGKSWGESTMQ